MITVAALFSQNSGDPATGLALAEIDLYLFRRTKATGAVATVLNGVHPTEEVGGGLYTRTYTGEDLDTYEYFGYAHYTGAAALDAEYSLHAGSFLEESTGMYSVTYTITVGGLPEAGVYCRMTTDATGLVNVDAGTTDALGQVTFHHDLASGTTVYVWRVKAGVSFSDPDVEVIP